jgi:hypothetical protein
MLRDGRRRSSRTDQVVHAQLAHVAERHRRTGRVLGLSHMKKHFAGFLARMPCRSAGGGVGSGSLAAAL